jgi:hypothetical protein
MQKILALAAASFVAIAVSGCGSTPTAGVATASAAGGSTMYCHEESLTSSAAGHTCNWSQNVRDVCDGFVPNTTLGTGDVTAAPSRSQRCNTGRWVVAVARA